MLLVECFDLRLSIHLTILYHLVPDRIILLTILERYKNRLFRKLLYMQTIVLLLPCDPPAPLLSILALPCPDRPQLSRLLLLLLLILLLADGTHLKTNLYFSYWIDSEIILFNRLL